MDLREELVADARVDALTRDPDGGQPEMTITFARYAPGTETPSLRKTMTLPGEELYVDALVVDLPREGTDGWMPLFVVLRDGASLDDDLRALVRTRIREDCSPRHVPNEIIQIAEVPRTLSGKVLEVPVKRILMGTPAGEAASRESLANPEALDWFVALASKA